LLAAILASFGLGTYFGKTLVKCEVCQPSTVNFSLFWEAWHKISNSFVGRGELDVQKMIYGAISGMVSSLGDPYTVFFTPDDTERFIDDVKGSFEGVGMEIAVKDGQLQVVAPLADTPAQKAGLMSGDKILKVNGTSTASMAAEEAVRFIRGSKGTSVTLTIMRDSWPEPREITLVRDIINIASLKLELRDDGIAYLRIYQFSEKAVSDFADAAIKILNSDSEKIILDLRGNPGGYLEVARYISGWFLEKNQVVTIEDFGNGQGQIEHKADGNGVLLNYPLVVLIDQGSASGSEILAGALRDNRGVQLIGVTSFGKGSVQDLEKLEDGSSLKITIARWLTPKGESISDHGLEPDIKVELTEKDVEEEKDPQMEKAIEVLQGL
jgi:carboxyl-terminal processing protease